MNHYSDLCTEVTARLVAAIESGPGGWVMPWHTTPGLFDVRNAATTNRYRGANTNTITLAVRRRRHHHKRRARPPPRPQRPHRLAMEPPRLTDTQADHGAIALGLHPAIVWPDWFAVAP